MRGTVIAVQANFYRVQVDGSLLLCTRRGVLKKLGQNIMVGDHVFVEENEVIVEVLPRKSLLERPPVANADQILLVFSLVEPPLEAWQLSRFLLKAESTGLGLCLAINKADLISFSEQEAWSARISAWGYEPLFISVKTEQGLASLKSRLDQKITIFAGPSGVGKSSLINQLIPQVEQRVGKVSGKLQRGRHTTRHVELFSLPQGGLLADTPGFNQPDLTCSVVELAGYFPEIRQRMSGNNCQFNNCLHHHEPNCIVRGNWERYEHYLKFLEEAIALEEMLEKRPDTEANTKLKIKGSGTAGYEPKLELKKYRRHSRRQEHQSLQDFCQGEEDD